MKNRSILALYNGLKVTDLGAGPARVKRFVGGSLARFTAVLLKPEGQGYPAVFQCRRPVAIDVALKTEALVNESLGAGASPR
jgi:hypothetical protein